MIFLFRLLFVFSRKNDFVIRPAEKSTEILRIYGNLSLRVDNKPTSLENWPLLLIQIGDLGDNYKSLKIAKNYICAPESGNIVETRTKFDRKACSWIVEETQNGTVALRNSSLYLVKTDEMDNRSRSHGLKLRLLPSKSAHNYKWVLKKAKHVFGPIEEDESEEKGNDLLNIPPDEHKKQELNEINKKTKVVGVKGSDKKPIGSASSENQEIGLKNSENPQVGPKTPENPQVNLQGPEKQPIEQKVKK